MTIYGSRAAGAELFELLWNLAKHSSDYKKQNYSSHMIHQQET